MKSRCFLKMISPPLFPLRITLLDFGENYSLIPCLTFTNFFSFIYLFNDFHFFLS